MGRKEYEAFWKELLCEVFALLKVYLKEYYPQLLLKRILPTKFTLKNIIHNYYLLKEYYPQS